MEKDVPTRIDEARKFVFGTGAKATLSELKRMGLRVSNRDIAAQIADIVGVNDPRKSSDEHTMRYGVQVEKIGILQLDLQATMLNWGTLNGKADLPIPVIRLIESILKQGVKPTKSVYQACNSDYLLPDPRRNAGERPHMTLLRL